VDADARQLPDMRRVLLTLLALILAVVLAGLWYATEKGFTRKWRGYVTEEFRKRGVEVTLSRLMLDPLRGLVAKDVRVLDAQDHRRTLAVIDEMALQVNFANLMRGKTFIDALELRDASLSLPLDPEKPRGPKIDIVRLNARLFLPPQQIYLARADAEIFGLRVSAAGRLIHPQALQGGGAPRRAISPDLMARIVEELGALKFESDPPVVNVSFSGDLAEPEKIFVDVDFWGERIRRENYALRSLYLTASYRGGVLDVKQLLATDATGELRLSGLWEPAAQEARFQLRTNLDAPALLRSCTEIPWLNDFVFYTPPRMDLKVSVSSADKLALRVLGHVETAKFACRTVVFESAAADFSWDGDRWSVRDLRLARANGEELTGDALQVPEEFRLRLRSTLNPKALRPLASGKAAEVLGQFEFAQPPEIKLEAHGAAPTVEALTVEGDISLHAASFRGVPAESASARLHYENQVLSIAPFRVERKEGSGDGNLYIDFRKNEVRLDKIRARVNPPEVAMWIDPKLVKDILPYRFPLHPPNLRIDGLVSTRRGKSTRLAIDVDAPAGMDYTFLRKNLSAPRVSARLLFTSDRLKISDLTAGLFGGTLKGGADISLERTHPGHTASLTLEDVDFAKLTKLYFDYENSQGRLNGRYDFTGRGDDARAMDGHGELTVTDGDVFAIPFLGPLSGILDGIVPGMGHTVARQAAASFSISDGVIGTENLVVQGNGFSMLGHGKLHFLDDKMNFDMRVNAQGLPGVLLFPVSKLFEYTADEKLSKPSWRLKMVPRL
jgi:hypothetical protein